MHYKNSRYHPSLTQSILNFNLTCFSISLVVVFLIGIGLTSSSYAALVAMTSKTIQGHPPRFIASIEEDINEGNDFGYFGINYSGIDFFTPEALGSKLAELSPLTITPANLDLSVALGVPLSTDIIMSDNENVMLIEKQVESVSMAWYYDNNGVELALTQEQQNQNFCSLATSNITPYIKISGDITLNIQYGDPNSLSYPNPSLLPTPVTQAPQRVFNVPVSAICYLKPTNMTVYSGQSAANSIRPETGYDDNQFDKVNGFFTTSRFPTTGFTKAKFQLIMAGGNDKYDYRVEDDGVILPLVGGSAEIDSSGNVTLNSKPKGQLAFIATSKKDQFEHRIVKTIDKWAVFYGIQQYNTVINFSGIYTAAISCGAPGMLSGIDNKEIAAEYLFSLAEITNVPGSGDTPIINVMGRYTRQTGTFMGEWGSMKTYAGSGWNTGPYLWSSQSVAGSETLQLIVGESGPVYRVSPNNTVNMTTMCRG